MTELVFENLSVGPVVFCFGSVGVGQENDRRLI